jgi:hypothetical protein
MQCALPPRCRPRLSGHLVINRTEPRPASLNGRMALRLRPLAVVTELLATKVFSRHVPNTGPDIHRRCVERGGGARARRLPPADPEPHRHCCVGRSRHHRRLRHRLPPGPTGLPPIPQGPGELIPSALHTVERCANNPVETDHGRLKARLWPMRGLKRRRSSRIIAAGHAFVQNLRRGHYELGADIPDRRSIRRGIRPARGDHLAT